MPAVAVLSPSPSAVPVPWIDRNRWADAPRAQGSEGKQVFLKAEEVYRHWTERAEVLILRNEETHELFCKHMPPNRTFFVKTRYVYKGIGQPQPLYVDEE